MSIEITNDAQADKIRTWLELTEELRASAWSPNPKMETVIGTHAFLHDSISNAKGILAAYEERKAVKDIVLSELEQAVLVQSFYNGDEINSAIRRLAEKRLVQKDINHFEYACDGLPAGRAYLAQKPKLRWEVWIKGHDDRETGFVCSTDSGPESHNIAYALGKYFTAVEYIVREVR